MAQAASKRRTASCLFFLVMKVMAVEYVRVTHSLIAWNKVVGIRNEEVMEKVWRHTMTRRVIWQTCKGPGSSVRFTA